VPNVDYLISLAMSMKRGDIFDVEEVIPIEQIQFNFVRFVEIVNKMKNTAVPQHTRQPSMASSSTVDKQTKEYLEQHLACFSPREVGTEISLNVNNVDKILESYLELMSKNPIQHTVTGDSLPNNIFISYDFVNWLRESVMGLENERDAIIFCQKKLLEEKKIRILQKQEWFTAFDGNRFRNVQFSTTTFHYGFVLYGIVTSDCFSVEDFDGLCLKADVNEIIQVEFSRDPNPLDDEDIEIGRCCDLRNLERKCKYEMQESSMEFPQLVHVRDPKVSYVEWGRVLAESMYSTGKAYEIWVKWFMATGQTVADAVLKIWARGASRIGFHLFAVPEDMFAEPKNPFSSPLRCPIFVKVEHSLIPKEFTGLILRKALKMFGFIPINCPAHENPRKGKELQYVHLCGGMFVKFVFSGGKGQFLWSWNHMFSQLYRTPICAESFLDMMLKDFRDFWENKNNRLETFIFRCLCQIPFVEKTEITSSLFPEVLLFNHTWNAIEDIKASNQNNPLLKYFTQLDSPFSV